MSLPSRPVRALLHVARLFDAYAFWPALAVVIWGELAKLPGSIEANDKLLHFIAYFGLSWLAATACRERRTAFFACLALAILGGVLEIVQNFVGRDMSAWDEVTNTIGVAVGGSLARMVVEPLRRRFPDPRKG